MSTSAEEIFAYVDGIVDRFHPRRVILFGSYAYGNPDADSDVDLLVISNKRSAGTAQALEILRACLAPFPMDLIVRSEQEILRRIGWNDYFLAEIMQKGLTLYAADHPGVGEKSRRRLRRRLDAATVA